MRAAAAIRRFTAADQAPIPDGLIYTALTRDRLVEFVRMANHTGNSFAGDQGTVDMLERILAAHGTFAAFAAAPANAQMMRDGLGEAFRYLFASAAPSSTVPAATPTGSPDVASAVAAAPAGSHTVSSAAPAVCVGCGKPTTARCARCRVAHFCSRACQRDLWPQHKLVCTPPA
jgi:hypothetical protein